MKRLRIPMAIRIAMVLLLAGCDWHVEPVEPEHPPIEPLEPTGAIETACERLRGLGCPEAEPTPEGATCEDVMGDAAAEGIDLAGDPNCTAVAQSCSEVFACVPAE